MAKQPIEVKQGAAFAPPRFSPGMYRTARLLGGIYLRLAQGVRKTRVANMEHLADAVARFQRGESRLMILFRHSAVSDGPVIISTVVRLLPRWCRRHRRRLPESPYIHFLYGKGVLNWAGALARLAFPRVGGIPVINARVDKESQRAIREVLTHGRFPLALAPEGQVTYHQFKVARLTPGSGTLAYLTHRDLRRPDGGRRPPGVAGSPGVAGGAPAQDVELLPVTIGYSYGRKTRKVLVEAVRRIAVAVGVTNDDALTLSAPDAGVLLELTGRVLGQVESEFGLSREAGQDDLTAESLRPRVDSLCRAVLEAGERLAGMQADDDLLNRIFRLRHWIMSSEYRDDIDVENLTGVERSVANFRARAAHAAQPLERLVDILSYLSPEYIMDKPSDRRLLEYAVNLLDVVSRAAGGEISDRYLPPGRVATVLIGEPIPASGIITRHDTSRAAVPEITDAVRSAFEHLTAELEAQSSES